MAVFVLRAEHDNVRVGVDLHVVARWPVKKIVRADGLLGAGGVGGGELAAQDKAPVGALAEVAFQPLEQRGGVDTRREAEVLTADLAQSGGVAEIRSLTDHCARDLHFYGHVFFGYSHGYVSDKE